MKRCVHWSEVSKSPCTSFHFTSIQLNNHIVVPMFAALSSTHTVHTARTTNASDRFYFCPILHFADFIVKSVCWARMTAIQMQCRGTHQSSAKYMQKFVRDKRMILENCVSFLFENIKCVCSCTLISHELSEVRKSTKKE